MRKDIVQEIQEQIIKLIDYLNLEIFNNSLQITVVNVMHDNKRVGSYSTSNGNNYECNFMLNHMLVSERIFVSRVLHEMIHVHNDKLGLKDTARDGRYHNAKFHISAIQHGMNVTYDQSVGYGQSFVNDDVFTRICENMILNDFSRHIYTSNVTGRKSNSFKHTCPSCGNIARTTKKFPLMCGECNEKMEVE